MGLYLVRHGETDWNLSSRIQGQTDIPLNDNGRAQARELSAAVRQRGLSPGRIYTSRMLRARETADIVAADLGMEAQILEGVHEINMGAWEGYTWRQVREEFPQDYEKWYCNRRYQIPPGGESYEQLLARVVPAMRKAAKEKGDSLIITHSAVIMTLLSYLNGTPFADMAKNFKTKNTELVELGRDMVCVLEQAPWGNGEEG